MADILEWNGLTRLDIAPDKILAKARGKLDNLVLIGFDKNGEIYFAASKCDGGEVLWLLESAKKILMEYKR